VTAPFELQIALRYLLAKRKQAFVSVISLVSTLGVTVGVMATVIALALMTGLQREYRDRILGSNPHIFVWKNGGITDYHAEVAKLRALPHVVGAAPEILDKAMLMSTGESQAFATIKGVDPALEPSVTDIRTAMQQGSLDDLAPSDAPDATDAQMLPGIVLGSDLAASLGVGVGDIISILTPHGTLTPGGSQIFPKRVRVAGTFSIGLFEIDSSYGFVSLDLAKRLFDKSEVDLIQLKVDDIFRATAVARHIDDTMGPDYFTEDWAQMNQALFSALTLEKIAIALTIGLIVMVAALNIVASLILLVMEKHRDIAILKTMGTSARSVTLIFMLQGLVIGVAGTAVGAGAGALVSWILDRYELIKVSTEVYQISHMPFKVMPLDFALVVSAAILICFVATIYPSRQAAKLDPAQALRYE
jgi:lipoprotein-releasing system permease protein